MTLFARFLQSDVVSTGLRCGSQLGVIYLATPREAHVHMDLDEKQFDFRSTKI